MDESFKDLAYYCTALWHSSYIASTACLQTSRAKPPCRLLTFTWIRDILGA